MITLKIEELIKKGKQHQQICFLVNPLILYQGFKRVGASIQRRLLIDRIVFQKQIKDIVLHLALLLNFQHTPV